MEEILLLLEQIPTNGAVLPEAKRLVKEWAYENLVGCILNTPVFPFPISFPRYGVNEITNRMRRKVEHERLAAILDLPKIIAQPNLWIYKSFALTNPDARHLDVAKFHYLQVPINGAIYQLDVKQLHKPNQDGLTYFAYYFKKASSI